MSLLKKFAKKYENNSMVSTLRKLGSVFRDGNSESQWARIVMNQETHRFVNRISSNHPKVLEISGNNWATFPEFGEYTNVRFPDYDVCEEVLPETYDLIIAEQIFEHLKWPYRAGKNVYRMLESGGFLMITTPFLIKIHGAPIDCTRWTETGLRYFLAECGFPLEKIQTFSWGNRACIFANFKRWQVFQRWRHSLANEPEFPVVVWAFAQKD